MAIDSHRMFHWLTAHPQHIPSNTFPHPCTKLFLFSSANFPPFPKFWCFAHAKKKHSPQKQKKSNQFDKTIFQFYHISVVVTFGWEEAKNRHIVCQRADEREKCLKKSEKEKILWQRKRLESIAVGKKLYFFTIIADILFGYGDVFVGDGDEGGKLSTYTRCEA